MACGTRCSVLLISAVTTAISSGCGVVTGVARAVGEACDRPSITVTTTADMRTPCSGDECSLWGAIALANTCNNGMVVQLQEDSLYRIDSMSPLRPPPAGTVFPPITGTLSINGNGAEIQRVSRTPFERFFLIQPHGDLTLSNLTLQRGGNDTGDESAGYSGGAIVNRGTLILEDIRILDNRSRTVGGAIDNMGRLIVRGGEYSNNRTGGGCEGGGGGFLTNRPGGVTSIYDAFIEANHGSCGGGILNEGAIAIVNTTLRNNIAGTGGDNTYSAGGALFNGSEDDNEPNAIIYKSTFTGNQAMAGGALANSKRSRMIIDNSTISGNHTYTPCPACSEYDPARHHGAGINNTGNLSIKDVTIVNNVCNVTEPVCGGGLTNSFRDATVTAANTIIANNVGGDCLQDDSVTPPARFRSMGINLDSDATCPSFVLHTTPMLGPLQNNGGMTYTHAVLPDSPPHNAGSSCSPHDQRNLPRARSEDDPCDIGAFELQ